MNFVAILLHFAKTEKEKKKKAKTDAFWFHIEAV